MKTGKTIVQLAQQLQDIQNNARDFVVPTPLLKMGVDGDDSQRAGARPVLRFADQQERQFELNSWSHRQLATHAQIPQQYYDRIRRENPSLLAQSVNHGLAMRGPEDTRMIRTYRGQVRAFVSNRYRRLDCIDLLETVAPLLMERDMDVVSSELTEQRMYLQVTTPRVQGEVKKGDVVQYGLVISSSDVGAGSVRVEPLIYRLACLNGMITSAALRKFHLGKTQGEGDVYELLSDSTRDLSDQAFWAQVKDVVSASMKPEIFEKQVDRLRAAANEPIKNFDIPRVVELASKLVGVANEGVQKGMVAYLANGADGAGLTRWGLANAFTWAANQDAVDYDGAVELERAGAKIIDMPASQWKIVSTAPAA